MIGALLGSFFVKYLVGNYLVGNNANLGANAPNYVFPIPVIFGTEVLASALLMAVILIVVYTNGIRGLGAITIGGIVVAPVVGVHDQALGFWFCLPFEECCCLSRRLGRLFAKHI